MHIALGHESRRELPRRHVITDGHLRRAYFIMAIRLDPRSPYSPKHMSLLAHSHYVERDYEGTVAVAKRALARYPADPRLYRWLAAALGQLGRTEEAGAALKEAIAALLAFGKFRCQASGVPARNL